MEENKNRKTTRMKGADYNATGVFFLTICTKERRCILSKVTNTNGELTATDKQTSPDFVGTGVPDGPKIKLTKYGKIADKYINQLNGFYNDLSVESYVIMPNHVHILLFVRDYAFGPSRTPVPTIQNTTVSRFVSTFKRFCNKDIGENIWQYRSYDHIIRNKQDYEKHLKYIYENPIRWYYDELYSNE